MYAEPSWFPWTGDSELSMSSITFFANESDTALETHVLLRVARASMFCSWVRISVSNRETVPELAAVFSSALLPMTALMAGSLARASWSFTSSYPASLA